MDFSTPWPTTIVQISSLLFYTVIKGQKIFPKVFEAFEDENERLANQLRHFWHRRNFLYRMELNLKHKRS